MTQVVIDTNVLLVANRQHPDVSGQCVIACVQRLLEIQERGCVVLDDGYEILNEYLHKIEPLRGKGVGDVFLKDLLRHTVRRVTVKITPDDQRGYAGFPDDTALTTFDRADRKFVATAAAHNPPALILQAADSKWLGWADALLRYAIRVEFLCRQDIERFAKDKAKRKPSSGKKA